MNEAPELEVVELGAAISVASTAVPVRSSRPFAPRMSLTSPSMSVHFGNCFPTA